MSGNARTAGGEYQLGQLLALDFGGGGGLQRRAPAPEPDGAAGFRASGTAAALVCGGLADGGQTEHGTTIALVGPALQTRVDHGGNAGDGERRFRDIGGQDDPLAAILGEGGFAGFGIDSGVQGQHRHTGIAQSLGRIPDLPPPRQEGQYRSSRLFQGPAHGTCHPVCQMMTVRHLAFVLRVMLNGYREATAFRLNQGRAQMSGDGFGGEGCGGDHQVMVATVPQQGEQQVRIPAPFMELVQDDGPESRQSALAEPAQGHAGRGENQWGFAGAAHIETYRVANALTQGGALLPGQEIRQGCAGHTPGFDHQGGSLFAGPYGQPGGLAGAGIRGDNGVALLQGVHEACTLGVNG